MARLTACRGVIGASAYIVRSHFRERCLPRPLECPSAPSRPMTVRRPAPTGFGRIFAGTPSNIERHVCAARTRGGHRRRRVRRAVHGHETARGRHPRLPHPGEGPRGRRHLARQHLSRRGLRRSVPFLLVLVRRQARHCEHAATQAGKRSSATSSDTTARHGLRSPRALRRSGELGALRRGQRALGHRNQDRYATGRAAPRAGNRTSARAADPGNSGPESFKGKVFHSARWDHGYDLDDKRVNFKEGVRCFGTSTATTGRQAARRSAPAAAPSSSPDIAPGVASHVFQRTPAWVISRDRRAYSEQQKRRYERFPWLRTLHRWRLYWTNESRLLGLLHPALVSVPRALALKVLRRQVRDPALVAALTPDYTFGCKRVLSNTSLVPDVRPAERGTGDPGDPGSAVTTASSPSTASHGRSTASSSAPASSWIRAST